MIPLSPITDGIAKLDEARTTLWAEQRKVRLSGDMTLLEPLLKTADGLLTRLEELDHSHNVLATQDPSYDFDKHQAALDVVALHLLVVCGNLVITALRQEVRPPSSERLAEHYGDWASLMNWTTDYAETPRFRAIVEQALRDYEAGNFEEGGWDL